MRKRKRKSQQILDKRGVQPSEAQINTEDLRKSAPRNAGQKPKSTDERRQSANVPAVEEVALTSKVGLTEKPEMDNQLALRWTIRRLRPHYLEEPRKQKKVENLLTSPPFRSPSKQNTTMISAVHYSLKHANGYCRPASSRSRALSASSQSWRSCLT